MKDPYLDSNDVLRNKLNIKNAKELCQAEKLKESTNWRKGIWTPKPVWVESRLYTLDYFLWKRKHGSECRTESPEVRDIENKS